MTKKKHVHEIYMSCQDVLKFATHFFGLPCDMILISNHVIVCKINPQQYEQKLHDFIMSW